MRMDRTLFTPLMVDTYRACKRAFARAFARFCLEEEKRSTSLSSICRGFIKRGLSSIDSNKLKSHSQLQAHVGQFWPLERVERLGIDSDKLAKAFLFSYKTLSGYLARPYRPSGSEIGAVSLKVRARVPSAKVYLEDTFDLVLFYPDSRHIEIVDYKIKAKQELDNHSKSICLGSLIAKSFLLRKLKVRWQYNSSSFTTVSLNPDGMQISKASISEELFESRWPEVAQDLEDMKRAQEMDNHQSDANCPYCKSLDAKIVKERMTPTSIDTTGLSSDNSDLADLSLSA